MEKLINNPGLHHLAENIFLNLNYEGLKKWQLINQTANHILNNPLLWINELSQNGLSKENQKDWIEAIQLETNFGKKKHLSAYLKWQLKKRKWFDFPCYTKDVAQEDFRDKIWKSCNERRSSIEHTEIVEILAPLTNKPNTQDYFGRAKTPIYWAARNGHTDIIQILAPLTDNPNAPITAHGDTPIHLAAMYRYKEIIKILVPLTDNSNFQNKSGETPISLAASSGHTDIVNMLTPLTNYPNAPDKLEMTPIHWAARNGHTGIVNILAPLADNPNAPDKIGRTPIQLAAQNGHTEVIQILAQLKQPGPTELGK